MVPILVTARGSQRGARGSVAAISLVAVLLVSGTGIADPARLPRVVAGPSHGMVILPGGSVQVFAHGNTLGELGQGKLAEPAYADAPLALPGIKDAVDGAAGPSFSLLLRSDGTVLAWGDNTMGQLGVGGPKGAVADTDVLQPIATPTVVRGLVRVKQLAAGTSFALALLDDGTVMAWGAASRGRLGLGPSVPSGRVVTPRKIPGLGGVRAIAAGDDFAFALLQDGTVAAWGGNHSGEVGDEVVSFAPSPVTVGGLADVKAIAAGVDYGLALLADGTVRVWGSGGGDGVMFLGAKSASIHTDAPYPWSAKPIAISGVKNAVAISAGANALVLLADGSVRAWGYNGHCSMGAGHCTEYPAKLQTPKVTGVVAIATGFNRSYFVTKDGTVRAAGSQLRSPDRKYRSPTPLVR